MTGIDDGIVRSHSPMIEAFSMVCAFYTADDHDSSCNDPKKIPATEYKRMSSVLDDKNTTLTAFDDTRTKMMASKHNSSLNDIVREINGTFLLDCSLDDANRLGQMLERTSKRYLVRKHDESMATYKVYNMSTQKDDIYRESMLLPLLHNNRFGRHFVKCREIVDLFFNIRTPTSMHRQRRRLFLHSELASQATLATMLQNSWKCSQASDDHRGLVHVVLRQHADGQKYDAFFRQPSDDNIYRKCTTLVKIACRFMTAFVVPTKSLSGERGGYEPTVPERMEVGPRENSEGAETLENEADVEQEEEKAEEKAEEKEEEKEEDLEEGEEEKRDAFEPPVIFPSVTEVASTDVMSTIESAQIECKDKLAILSEMF